MRYSQPIIDGKRKCSRCKIVKEIDLFPNNVQGKGGKKSVCKQCCYLTRKKYEDRNKEIQKQRRISSKINARLKISSRAKAIYYVVKKRQPDTDVSLLQIEVMLYIGKCNKSSIPFQLHNSDNKRNPFGPSIDRVDNNKGYTSDNVQLVCNMFNIGKNSYSELDFIAMCCAVAERYRNDVNVADRLKELRGGL